MGNSTKIVYLDQKIKMKIWLILAWILMRDSVNFNILLQSLKIEVMDFQINKAASQDTQKNIFKILPFFR